MTAYKKLKRGKNITIEDLYQNKNFVPPKEQNLETIFEEPKQAKDGAPIMTSVRKYKRYLDFDPITGKVQKPKKKGKQFEKKIKRKTRSASKTVRNIDISAVLETLNDSSDECDMTITVASKCGDGDHTAKDSASLLPIEDKIINNNYKNKVSVISIDGKTISDIDHLDKNSNSEILFAKTVNGDHETVHSVDETINDEVLCEKCTLTENFCSCDFVRLSKIKEDSLSKMKQKQSHL